MYLFRSSRYPTLPHQFSGYKYSVEQGLQVLPQLGRYSSLRSKIMTFSLLMILPLGGLGNSKAFYMPPKEPISMGLVALSPLPANPSPLSPPISPRISLNKLPDSDASLITETNISPLPWLYITIHPGDTLSHVFERYELKTADLQKILAIEEVTKQLAQLKPQQELHIKSDRLGNVQELTLALDFANELYIYREEAEFIGKIRQKEVQTQIVSAYGTVQSSLFAAGQKAGLSDPLIIKLLKIFRWDVNAQDIEFGDKFSLVYERHWIGGEEKDGEILAAEFINQGEIYRAVRYVDADGRSDYYKPNGESLRKEWLHTPVEITQENALKTPIHFSHISSYFGVRKHPIYSRMRMHQGVDLAAPVGTPIVAAADAKIKFLGYRHGYGKTVILQHDERHDTLYAHMSRFAEDVKLGDSVQQGDVIGYVGQSGSATGPHLHYEFHVDGVYQNPLNAKLPSKTEIRLTEVEKVEEPKADFFEQSRNALAQLDAICRFAQTQSLANLRFVQTDEIPQ